MSDEFIFFLILAALYLEESSLSCSIWEIFFQGGIFSKISVCGNFARKRSRGLAFLLPSFFSPSFISAEDNLSFDEYGVSNLRLSAYPLLRATPSKVLYLKFDDILTIEIKDDFLLLNGKIFSKSSSAELAKVHKALIEKLKKTLQTKRKSVLENYLRGRFNLARAKGILSESKSQIKRLRIVSGVHFFVFFVLFPLTYLIFPNILFFAIGLCVCLLFSLILIPYFCVEKYKADKKWKFFALKCVSFFPFLSIINREIYLHQLEDFHPSLLAGILLKKEAAKKYFAASLRDLKYPIIRVENSDALVCATNFNAQIFEYTHALANKIFETPNFDFEISAKNFPKNVLSYCPRCGAAFCCERKDCSDCFCPVEKQN